MPPSSTRRSGLRSRREPDLQQSDADTPESIATPTRKRRRLNGNDRPATATPAVTEDAPPPRPRVAESVASNDSNVTLPNGAPVEDTADPIERQNLVIGALRTPGNYAPNASIDYANDLQARRNQGNNVAAFAKIAARDWCFFVQKTILLIGRADSAIRPNPPTSSQDTGPQSADPAAEWGVDIDLGPERQVSRVHAQIDFDSTQQKWYISVNSRNGLKLDDVSLGRGHRAQLHSGICIGIMGTQMLFLLANEEDQFHPMLWRQLKNDPEAEESDKEGGGPGGSRSLPHAHPSGPTPKREAYDPFPPSSHPRHKQSSQAYSMQLTSTPGRPQPGTPLAFRSSERGAPSQGSPSNFPRSIFTDPQGEDIDYSQDAAKDIKPPHSYAQLIGQAILSSPEEMLTLANIYQFIKDRYAFFRHTNGGWQNSIRHNLSLSKVFEKVARRTDEPGKGMKWKIADNERDDFLRKQLVHPRKGPGGARMDSSGPNSPALRDGIPHATLVGAMAHNDVFAKHERGITRIKTPPRSATPPLMEIPSANEAYTPDRGPRPPNSFYKQSPAQGEHSLTTPAKRLFQDHNPGAAAFPEVVDPKPAQSDSSPTSGPSKPKVAGMRHVAHSPPPLYSDTPAANANGAQDATRMNNAGLVTPLVTRHAPRLAPPSTAQVPSQYMNFSSPAPFWKYVDLPSTPARAPNLDISPIKMKKDEDVDEKADDISAQPSSPPIIDEPSNDGEDQDINEDEAGKGEDNDDEDLAPESPSRTVSRPVSRRDVPGSQRSRSNSAAVTAAHVHTQANGFGGVASTGGADTGAAPMVRGASLGSVDEEEEEGFDLAK
ncbi:fork head domain-containing protein [Lophiotrema nucula]|uniref:Fork head domain-containing protein n=1 Tax=Lophiotrema nucula TaxID=690887 RepID=A0A6A5Z693_9PLEO|nr:fork head domain-containing protein [Lophiotrema nucula]